MKDELPKSVQDLVAQLSESTLTKPQFEALLTKAAQPKTLDSKETGTSESRPSDGYSGKRKSQGKTEGKED